MKKILLLFLLSVPFLVHAQVVRQLKKTITLQMPKKSYDDMPGTRGTAVAWHPSEKKYYAAFAGNEDFPMAVFDAKGKRISSEKLICLIDVRGLWYNSKQKKICGNAFGDKGWFAYSLDNKGIPESNEILAPGRHQPGDQSVGTYDNKEKEAYFLEGQFVRIYLDDGEESRKSIRLYPGISRKEDMTGADDGLEINEDYNNNVIVFTGIKDAEFGLLNAENKQVELYSRKTGLMTQKLKLPDDVATYFSFNFSYCNNIFWFFDQETRAWMGFE